MKEKQYEVKFNVLAYDFDNEINESFIAELVKLAMMDKLIIHRSMMVKEIVDNTSLSV